MQHTNPKGESKLLPKCSLPLTGVSCVKKIVSDLGVFEITHEGFRCLEYAPGVTIDEIKAKTLGRLVIADDVKEIVFN
jgi:3-oxoacid CoA-transferase subunit B